MSLIFPILGCLEQNKRDIDRSDFLQASTGRHLAFLSGNVQLSTADGRQIRMLTKIFICGVFRKVGLAHLLQAADVASRISQKGLRLVGSTVEVSGSYDIAYRQ